MPFFVTFTALDGKLVITSVANQPNNYLPKRYTVGQFLLSVFDMRNNAFNEKL